MSTRSCDIPMILKSWNAPRGSQVHVRIHQETLVEGVDSQILMSSVSGICKSVGKSAGLQTLDFSSHRGNVM